MNEFFLEKYLILKESVCECEWGEGQREGENCKKTP